MATPRKATASKQTIEHSVKIAQIEKDIQDVKSLVVEQNKMLIEALDRNTNSLVELSKELVVLKSVVNKDQEKNLAERVAILEQKDKGWKWLIATAMGLIAIAISLIKK